jgi:hypothetical protein
VASPALQRPEAPGRLESDARRPVPEEIKGLNWGALLLNFFWAIGNQVRVGLLCLVPGVGICVAFYLLFRGNELAWQGPRKWQSVAEFKAVQTAWTKWSIGLLTAYIVLWLAYGAGLPRSPLLAFSIIAITVILFLAWKRRVR